jgi:GWxTD domain-containing protein
MLLMFLCSCAPKRETGYSNLLVEKEQKLRETSNLPLETSFYRAGDTLCKLYFRVDPKYFLMKYDSLGTKTTRFKIALEIKANHLGSKVLFQNEFERQNLSEKPVLDSFVFSLPEFKTVFWELKIIDEYKHVYQSTSAFWERELPVIPEDFILMDSTTNELYTQRFIKGSKVRIKSNLPESIFQLEIFSKAQAYATPIFQIENNPLYAKPESPEIKIGNLAEITEIVNALNGEVYFRLRGRSEQKMASFNFTKVNLGAERTIAPLCYLLNSEESVSFNNWSKFWEKASGNDTEQAERLIKEFNRRVDYANNHFSSHKMGWKTDRGMIYILFGHADRVIDDIRSTVWSYGFTSAISNEFVFIRNPNGLHPEDYILEWNIGFRELYLSAIERWENGWVKMGWDGNE